MSEMRYGDNGTIHKTGELGVETDESGKVVSVWFRCMPLPFKQTIVDSARAKSMGECYEELGTKITAVVIDLDE